MSLNLNNLHVPSSEEARINGAKGGSSPKKKATLDAKKLMRTILKSSPVINEKTKKSLTQLGVNFNDEQLTTNIAVIQAVIVSKALSGDLNAAKMALEMSGQAVSAKDINDRERLALERERLKFDKQHNTQISEAVANINPFVQALMNSETAMTLNDIDVPEGVKNGADKAEE